MASNNGTIKALVQLDVNHPRVRECFDTNKLKEPVVVNLVRKVRTYWVDRDMNPKLPWKDELAYMFLVQNDGRDTRGEILMVKE